MGTSRSANTDSKMRRTLNARKWARGKASVLCVLGVVVTLGVAGLLMQNVMAAKTKVRVLDCPVTEAVAHHHNADCYDEHGELVCPLPERELHTHSKECYERQLVCETEEGEGAHLHDESCYDEEGNLVCKLKEGKGHKHTDDCYADILVCGKEEVTEEHVHGDGCFHMVAVDTDADKTVLSEQNFTEELLDKDGDFKLRVEVSAPEGALPEGTTMEVAGVEPDSVDRDALQVAIDDKAAKLETLEPGKLLDFLGVDITFRDDEGASIEPRKDVTVKMTSDFIETDDSLVVMHIADGKADPTAEVIDTLSEKQLTRRDVSLDERQVAFDTSSFSTYLLATVSKGGKLTASDDAGLEFSVEVPAEAGIPQRALLNVDEIEMDEDGYDGYVDRSTEAMQLDKDDVGLARFFDITIVDEDDNEIHPQAPVDVKIVVPDVPTDAEDFKLVHFAEDADGNQAEAPEELIAGGENGTTTFTADSFSVFGVIYTVDFGYQVGDKVYEFSIPGGDTIGMTEVVDTLHIYENAPKKYNSADKFVEGIQNVEFSNTGFVLPKWIDQRTSVKDVIDQDGLKVEYPTTLTKDEYDAVLAKEYEHEWALFSLKPFSSTEMLTITMADGSQCFVKVTDGRGNYDHGNPTPDGRLTVKSISNPGSTTIDVFDYWTSYSPEEAVSLDKWFRNQWGGHINDFNYNQRDGLNGFGNWDGINAGHTLKFVPANAGTVRDANNNINADGGQQIGGQRVLHVNDYTGNANMTQGLVEKTLVNGYPKLTNNVSGRGTDGQSLAYLFNYDDTVAGKRIYRDVEGLLYEDTSDHYYRYDSRDVSAELDTSSGENRFNLYDQRTNEGTPENGFWPFPHAEGSWWFGMHVNSNFMQPKNGEVNGEAMKFEFSGDDDAWVFIDDVLVGDGGGIHNRTEIDINFKTGEVVVTGLKDQTHGGSLEQRTTLRQLFIDAGKDATYIQERFGDTNTFLYDTAHVFDFFYLERGGGESNLMLHYNLLSTTDFSGKKVYTAEDGSSLQNNQFQFIFAGIYGRVGTLDDGRTGILPGTEGEPPIMPEAPDNGIDGAGIAYNNPSLVKDMQYPFDDGIHGTQTLRASVFTTKNMADGLIQFGTATIPQSAKDALDADPSNPPRYRYIIFEKIPDDAVNAYGRTWAQSTTMERVAGGYYKDSILYSNQSYYLEYKLVKQQDPYNPNAFKYVLEPTWYHDIYFSNPYSAAEQTDMELEFENSYIIPVTFDVQKTDKDDNTKKLEGAKFQLGFGYYNGSTQKWEFSNTLGQQVVSDDQGKVHFARPLPPGYYLLREEEAPDGYKLSDKMWVIHMVRVETPVPHVEPELKVVDADGTDPSPESGFVNKSTDVVENQSTHTKTALEEFTNEELDKYKLTVKKLWPDVDGRDEALEQSQVEVLLGRYIKEKRTGTLRITKTGVPPDATTIGVYIVNKVVGVDPVTGDDIEERYGVYTNSTWRAETGKPSMELEIPVPAKTQEEGGTTYKVYEGIYAEDPRYSALHNQFPNAVPNPQKVTIYEGSSDSADFNALYTQKLGELYVKTKLTTNGYTVDPSGVTYTLYDSSQTPLKTWTWDEIQDAYDEDTGFYLGTYPVGQYGLVESGWPKVTNADCHRNPVPLPSGVSASARDLDDMEIETFEFETEYTERRKVTVYLYAYHKGDMKSLTQIGSQQVSGSYATVTFTTAPGTTDYTDTGRVRYDDYVIVGDDFNHSDYDITWDAYTDGSVPVQGSVTVPLPTNSNQLVVYVGSEGGTYDADEDKWTPPTTTLVSVVEDTTRGADGTRSSGDLNAALTKKLDALADDAEDEEPYGRQGMQFLTKGLSDDVEITDMGAIALADPGTGSKGGNTRSSNTFTPQTSAIKAGNYWVPGPDEYAWLSWDGQGRPEDTTDWYYHEDSTFNAQTNLILLSQADNDTEVTADYWKKVVEDVYPAYDDDGNQYFYYVQAVRENHMPKGTEAEIVKNGDKQIVSCFIDNDTDPETLLVSNTVAAPTDLIIYKVDENNHATKLDGAVFHLEQKDDQQQWVTVTDETVVATTGGAAIAVDSTTGQFTIPAGGATIKDLFLGEYKLVEDLCPPGYVMSQTEFEFSVDQAGVVTSTYKTDPTDDDCITLEIPNPPGSELPHAGGVGETLFTLAGAALMVVGATMLLKRRREA